MSNHSAATGLKTWIVVIASSGVPMTDEMTMASATKWAQKRNGMTGATTYICKYVGI